MLLNLSHWQLKPDDHIYSQYIYKHDNHNQNPTMDTQKIKRMELKHNFKGIHQVTREESKRRQGQEKKYKNEQKQLENN